MPYRRQPKTDPARIKALQQLTCKEGYKEDGQLVLSYQTIRDAQQMLSRFRILQRKHQEQQELYRASNREMKREAATARQYVTHFVKVLHMTVQRGELPADVLALYGLDPHHLRLPRLTAERDLALWGMRIIEGEQVRVVQGGVPLYNPSIARVKVYYNVFADRYTHCEAYRRTMVELHSELAAMRPLVDELLADLWSQVDEFYARYPMAVRLQKGALFGVDYFQPRQSRKHQAADQLQGLIQFDTPTAL